MAMGKSCKAILFSYLYAFQLVDQIAGLISFQLKKTSANNRPSVVGKQNLHKY